MQILPKAKFVLRDENPEVCLVSQKERGTMGCAPVQLSCDRRREADVKSGLYGAEVFDVAVSA